MKPSIFAQLQGSVLVGTRFLKASPRHWNPGLLRYKGRLWMCYRYHLPEPGGRCATAIVELDQKTLQPCAESQHLAIPDPTKTEHHEDARLFMLGETPCISFTEMIGYMPGVDYRCTMKYAKLRFRANKWEVLDVHQPDYGSNNGHAKEKNWVFFDHEGKVHCVYACGPKHTVLELDSHRVVAVHESESAVWNFGEMRGGTTPVKTADGNWLSLFHSSVKTEIPPHFVRYYSGAYIFSGKPPFEILQISTHPFMTGSEEDGHQTDPRYAAGWKPFVVFPCGLVEWEAGWLTSFGVNDWLCGITKVQQPMMNLGKPDGSDFKPRFFRTENGTMRPRIRQENGSTFTLDWIIPKRRHGMASPGYMTVTNPSDAQFVCDYKGVEEISEEEFDRATALLVAHR